MLLNMLVVEDDPLIASMIEDYLELLGRRSIAVVGTVEDALSAIAEQAIDAAIIDIHLADGETSEPIALALCERNIPFLVCSGGPVGATAPAYANHPQLLKPFSFKSIEAALRTLES